MDIEVTREKENKLLGRKEIYFTLSYSGNRTPSKDEIKEEICKKLSLKPDLTSVINVSQEYGNSTSQASVYYYSTKEAMERLTRKPKEAKEVKPAPAAPAAKPEKNEQKEEKKEQGEEKKEEKKHKEEKHETKEEKKGEGKAE